MKLGEDNQRIVLYLGKYRSKLGKNREGLLGAEFVSDDTRSIPETKPKSHDTEQMFLERKAVM